MNALNLNYVNRLAPYKVWSDDGCDYYVETDRGYLFKVGFMEDYAIWQSGAYQLTINNESSFASPNDAHLRDTFYRLFEAFFAANPDILLYICETGDDRQKYRQRLFIHWFNSYPHHRLYVMETAEIVAEGEENFAAMIVQRSNPHLPEILSEFKETINLLKK